MNFNVYQTQAMSYRLPTANEGYAILNLQGEVGELSSLLAKSIRDGIEDEDTFYENMKKELGDILWCLAAVAADSGYSLSEVAQANLDKLQSRKLRQVLQGSGDNR